MKPDPLQQLREVHAVQGRKGCYDIDDYMLGLYNGLELALSLMEQRDVKYKEREALAKQEHGCEFCNHPMYVGTKCKNCGATKQEQGEPVAWLGEGDMKAITDLEKQAWIQAGRSELVETYNKPLYTHPQPKREPLTDEQRLVLLTAFEPHKNKWEAHSILIDMVEAAHGIKGEA